MLLASTTGAAQASSAQALSLSNSPAPVRASTDASKGNELVDTSAWVLAAIGLSLIVWAVIELTEDDNADSN